MDLDKIRRAVDGIPHMTPHQGETITAVILDNHFQNILELGFRHGVSTCYIAGALDELGGGHVTTIDLDRAAEAKPNIDSLLNMLGLAHYVTVHYERSGYLWRMMQMLKEDPEPRFDFCYIDGAHDWNTDGFAFFLVERLLVPGGLIIFDDLDWTYARSNTLANTERVQAMPDSEKHTPQIRMVFELLVKTHPSFDRFVEKDGWAYAYKSEHAALEIPTLRTEVIYGQKSNRLTTMARRIRRVIGEWAS